MVIWTNLTIEERVALQQKFNELVDSRTKTLEEIANELDVSYERACVLRSRYVRSRAKEQKTQI